MATEKTEKTKSELQKEQNAKDIKKGFLNPFSKGVTYEAFLDAVKVAKKGVDAYCKGKITDEQIEWLERDLEHIKK